jgi:hypothetical protein
MGGISSCREGRLLDIVTQREQDDEEEEAAEAKENGSRKKERHWKVLKCHAEPRKTVCRIQPIATNSEQRQRGKWGENI